MFSLLRVVSSAKVSINTDKSNSCSKLQYKIVLLWVDLIGRLGFQLHIPMFYGENSRKMGESMISYGVNYHLKVKNRLSP